MLRYLAPLAIFILLVVLFSIGLTLDPTHVSSPLINKPGPKFAVPSLKQPQRIFSNSKFHGQISLFNVWASWCAACRVEHPLLIELTRSQVVPIYGLNYKDKRQDALKWLSNLGDPYRSTAFDEAGKVGLDWGVYGVPETFIVDSHGMIRYKHIGPLDKQTWDETIYPLIKDLQKEQA